MAGGELSVPEQNHEGPLSPLLWSYIDDNKPALLETHQTTPSIMKPIYTMYVYSGSLRGLVGLFIYKSIDEGANFRSFGPAIS
jgi:hypothetical protein